jgi:hypothetical protein
MTLSNLKVSSRGASGVVAVIAPPQEAPKPKPPPPAEPPAEPRTRDEILAAIDRLIGPRFGPRLHPGCIAALGQDSFAALVSNSDLKTLRDLQGRWSEAWTLANAHDPGAARREMQAHQDFLTEKILHGEPIGPESGWSLDEWKSEHEAKISAARAAAARLSAQAQPLALAILKKLLPIVRTRAQDFEVGDFESHRHFGVEFRPSPLVTALHDLAAALERHLEDPPKPSASLAPERQLLGALKLA